jgi:hypothetical protein
LCPTKNPYNTDWTFQAKTKLSQAAEMIVDIGEHFSEPPLLAVTDSWFGNAGLLKPVRQVLGKLFDMTIRS